MLKVTLKSKNKGTYKKLSAMLQLMFRHSLVNVF